MKVQEAIDSQSQLDRCEEQGVVRLELGYGSLFLTGAHLRVGLCSQEIFFVRSFVPSEFHDCQFLFEKRSSAPR